MNPDLMKHRDKATKIQERYYERLTALKDDGDLTSEGRQRRIAEEYVRAKRDLSALSTAEREALSHRYEALQTQLYKQPSWAIQDQGSHAISLRDAATRVAQFKNATQAAQELAVAESNGDSVMAQAILRRSVEQAADDAWAEVAQTYIERHTEIQPLVEELSEIETMSARQVFSPFTATIPTGVTPQYINEAWRAIGADAGAVV